MSKQSGQVSKTLIILAVIILVLILLVFAIIRFVQKRPDLKESLPENQKIEPVYETTIQDTRFLFISAENLGSTLAGRAEFYQKDLNTTEKFIRVTIGAQNKGKVNLPDYSWDMGNIVDSDGRNFVSISEKAYYFLPQPTSCQSLLKPEFEPTPCVKMYEVSKASTNLKVTVTAINQNSKKQSAFLDLLVTK